MGIDTQQKVAAQRRILVVEDDPVNSMMLESLLRKHGYEVQIARNGHEALSRLADEHYQLLLMDGQMPDMDGITAAQEIRRLEQERPGAPRVPIVAVSGYALREDRERFLRAGMDGFISKPIDIDQLLRLIKQFG
jgi:CheY-like chemotaxis protein